jgi:hypothetical protein
MTRSLTVRKPTLREMQELGAWWKASSLPKHAVAPRRFCILLTGTNCVF